MEIHLASLLQRNGIVFCHKPLPLGFVCNVAGGAVLCKLFLEVLSGGLGLLEEGAKLCRGCERQKSHVVEDRRGVSRQRQTWGGKGERRGGIGMEIATILCIKFTDGNYCLN